MALSTKVDKRIPQGTSSWQAALGEAKARGVNPANRATAARRVPTPAADPVLSFIVPVFNEEIQLGGALEAIDRIAASLPHEIIVVDNGSTDRSLQIAEDMGAACHRLPDISIGALRNFGAAQANADILIFIDADVYLQDKWGAAIAGVVQNLHRDAAIITGSRCGISERPSWIENYWIAPFAASTECTFLGSGHLIVRRSLFGRLGGFDEELETGEDYDFCQRGAQAGVKIINNLNLKVIHEGYPRTLKAFFRRERWYGRSDATSVAAIVASKPTFLGVLQVLALAVLVLAAIAFRLPSLLLAFPAVTIPIWIASSFHRCRSLGAAFWIDIGLYGVYFAARAAAVFDILTRRSSRRRSHTFVRE